MAENSKIEWTDHTFNPWVGCTKVSPACDWCYAESWAKRAGHPELWAGERRRTAPGNWLQPLKWQKLAAATGERKRVFCASLADVFDNQVPSEWRSDLWVLIRETPHLDWLLLTKRIGNASYMLPDDWQEWLPNIRIGATVINQEEADRDLPKLVALDCPNFISVEPMLGPISLFFDDEGALRGPGVIRDGGTSYIPGEPDDHQDSSYPGIDWVICGGESGGKARSMPDVLPNIFALRMQADESAFFHEAIEPGRHAEVQRLQFFSTVTSSKGVARCLSSRLAMWCR